MNCISPSKLERKKLNPGPWSLWDMLKINAQAFYRAVTWSHRLEVIGEIHGDSNDSDKIIGDSPKSEDVRVKALADANLLLAELRILGATLSVMSAERFIKALAEKRCTFKQATEYAEAINSRLRDELSLISLFYLDADRSKYILPNVPLFGAEVEVAFPSAASEVAEAGKALGFSMPTASVFHLMRVMEIGIRSIARCLSIPDPTKAAERNWGTVLRDIKTELDKRSAAKSWRDDDRAFFESAYVSLDAVRVAWRNTTMHVEKRYTQDEADHIYAAVRAFIRNLAGRCGEEGKPLA